MRLAELATVSNLERLKLPLTHSCSLSQIVEYQELISMLRICCDSPTIGNNGIGRGNIDANGDARKKKKRKKKKKKKKKKPKNNDEETDSGSSDEETGPLNHAEIREILVEEALTAVTEEKRHVLLNMFNVAQLMRMSSEVLTRAAANPANAILKHTADLILKNGQTTTTTLLGKAASMYLDACDLVLRDGVGQVDTTQIIHLVHNFTLLLGFLKRPFPPQLQTVINANGDLDKSFLGLDQAKQAVAKVNLATELDELKEVSGAGGGVEEDEHTSHC